MSYHRSFFTVLNKPGIDKKNKPNNVSRRRITYSFFLLRKILSDVFVFYSITFLMWTNAFFKLQKIYEFASGDIEKFTRYYKQNNSYLYVTIIIAIVENI